MKDAAFLRNLLLRVSKVSPEGTSGFEFVRFDASGPYEGRGMMAMIRFRAKLPGEAVQTMRGTASFDPKTCEVGELWIRRGQAVDH